MKEVAVAGWSPWNIYAPPIKMLLEIADKDALNSRFKISRWTEYQGEKIVILLRTLPTKPTKLILCTD